MGSRIFENLSIISIFVVKTLCFERFFRGVRALNKGMRSVSTYESRGNETCGELGY